MNYLVTGCSRGVGLEICRVLLEQGHTVYGVARSYTDEFKKLESEFDNKLFFKSIDLGDSENVHRNVFKDFVNNRNSASWIMSTMPQWLMMILLRT